MRKAIRMSESLAPCVAGETRITLADGSERSIQSLYEGEDQELSVLSLTDDWHFVPTRVVAITRRAAPDLFTIRLRHGQIQATSNHLHPVLRDGQLTWVRTDALRADDHVAVPKAIPTPSAMPEMAGFLPPETRLHAPEALMFARPQVRTAQRRYAAQRRGSEYVRVAELSDPLRPPSPQSLASLSVTVARATACLRASRSD
ncbi:MAG: hypothetical protein C4321_05220 [Chloroflexota bacterium]